MYKKLLIIILFFRTFFFHCVVVQRKQTWNAECSLEVLSCSLAVAGMFTQPVGTAFSFSRSCSPAACSHGFCTSRNCDPSSRTLSHAVIFYCCHLALCHTLPSDLYKRVIQQRYHQIQRSTVVQSLIMYSAMILCLYLCFISVSNSVSVYSSSFQLHFKLSV